MIESKINTCFGLRFLSQTLILQDPIHPLSQAKKLNTVPGHSMLLLQGILTSLSPMQSLEICGGGAHLLLLTINPASQVVEHSPKLHEVQAEGRPFANSES